jgi:hypothetical protein
MKVKSIIISLFTLSLIYLMGCDSDSTAGYTRITFYPTIELQGESVVFVDKGDTYNDPGVKAELNGEDFTDQVQVVSSLDTNKPGIYTITYVATNEDGFSATVSRTVFVKDTTPSVLASGFYTLEPGSYRDRDGAITPYSGYPIIVLQTSPGIFYVSDFLGGYYEKRAGYGSKYAAAGYFKLNTDNSISLISSYVAGWGDELDGLIDASYDVDTKTISWVADYAGMYFYIIMKQTN